MLKLHIYYVILYEVCLKILVLFSFMYVFHLLTIFLIVSVHLCIRIYYCTAAHVRHGSYFRQHLRATLLSLCF